MTELKWQKIKLLWVGDGENKFNKVQAQFTDPMAAHDHYRVSIAVKFMRGNDTFIVSRTEKMHSGSASDAVARAKNICNNYANLCVVPQDQVK